LMFRDMFRDAERVKIAEVTADSGLLVIADPHHIDQSWRSVKEARPVGIRFRGEGASALRDKLTALGHRVEELNSSAFHVPAASLAEMADLMAIARNLSDRENVIVTPLWSGTLDALFAAAQPWQGGQFPLGSGVGVVVPVRSETNLIIVHAVYAEVGGTRRIVRVELDLVPEDEA